MVNHKWNKIAGGRSRFGRQKEEFAQKRIKKTRLHHQQEMSGRGSTGTALQVYEKMNKQYLEKIFSIERVQRYLNICNNDEARAMLYYQSNIEITEACYPCISILEISLRNAVNRQLSSCFQADDWYSSFYAVSGLGNLIPDIETAKRKIVNRRESVISPKVIAELTLGFWVRLFNAEYERPLWKHLRLAFPYLAKPLRQRRRISAPLNDFRIFRNRIFHHEPILWNVDSLIKKHEEMIQLMGWIDKYLPAWVEPFDRFGAVLNKVRTNLKI